MMLPSMLRTPHRFPHSCSCTAGKQICSHSACTKRTLMKCLLLNAARPCLTVLEPAAGRPSHPRRNLSSCQVSLSKAEDKGVPSTSTEGGVGAPARSVLPPPQPWHAVLSEGRRAPLWEPFAALLCTGGGETASILTLCWLTQSPSMAAALAVGFVPAHARGNGGQHQPRALSSTCSKGHPAPCPASPAPSSAPCPQGWQAQHLPSKAAAATAARPGSATPGQPRWAAARCAAALRMHLEQIWSSRSQQHTGINVSVNFAQVKGECTSPQERQQTLVSFPLCLLT